MCVNVRLGRGHVTRGSAAWITDGCRNRQRSGRIERRRCPEPNEMQRDRDEKAAVRTDGNAMEIILPPSSLRDSSSLQTFTLALADA